MGDVAMVVPVLRAFSQQYPGVKLTIVSRAFFKPIFDGIKNVNFYAADISKAHKGVVGLYQLFKELQAFPIDAVADLHNVIRSKILRSFFKMKGIPTFFIDKGRNEKKALTRKSNKIFKQLKTTHERYEKVFSNIGYPILLNKVSFPEKTELNTELLGKKNKKWIGIAPFAQYESKTYPEDLMFKVILALNEMDVKVILFGGGKTETALLRDIEEKISNCVSVAGKFSFKQELSIISNLDVMLSMDSGNAHLAAMFGVTTITLWGITHPFAGFAPFLQQDHCILSDLNKYPNIPCSIYGNKVCDGYEDAMRSIEPDFILQKVLAVTK